MVDLSPCPLSFEQSAEVGREARKQAEEQARNRTAEVLGEVEAFMLGANAKDLRIPDPLFWPQACEHGEIEKRDDGSYYVRVVRGCTTDEVVVRSDGEIVSALKVFELRGNGGTTIGKSEFESSLHLNGFLDHFLVRVRSQRRRVAVPVITREFEED